MNRSDDRILELLADCDLFLSPAVVAINLNYSRKWVARRLESLENSGLVEGVDGQYYHVTDRGRAYLAGELDPDDLETRE